MPCISVRERAPTVEGLIAHAGVRTYPPTTHALPRHVPSTQTELKGPPANFPGMPLPKGVQPAQTDRFNQALLALILRHGTAHQLAIKAVRAIQNCIFVEHGNKMLEVTDEMIQGVL